MSKTNELKPKPVYKTGPCMTCERRGVPCTFDDADLPEIQSPITDAAIDDKEAAIAEEQEQFRAETWRARTRATLDEAAKTLRDLGAEIAGHFVWCNPKRGLSEDGACEAIRILGPAR